MCQCKLIAFRSLRISEPLIWVERCWVRTNRRLSARICVESRCRIFWLAADGCSTSLHSFSSILFWKECFCWAQNEFHRFTYSDLLMKLNDFGAHEYTKQVQLTDLIFISVSDRQFSSGTARAVGLMALHRSASKNERSRDGFVWDKKLMFSIILFSSRSADWFAAPPPHLATPISIVMHISLDPCISFISISPPFRKLSQISHTDEHSIHLEVIHFCLD